MKYTVYSELGPGARQIDLVPCDICDTLIDLENDEFVRLDSREVVCKDCQKIILYEKE